MRSHTPSKLCESVRGHVTQDGEEARDRGVPKIFYQLSRDVLRRPLHELLAPDFIVTGDALAVPLWSRPASEAAQNPSVAVPDAGRSTGTPERAVERPSGPFVYELEPGDTLQDVASKFGVDVYTLVNNNELGNADLVRAGTQITVLPVSGLKYTVEPGDTLEGIARTFKVDLGPIIDFNYLENSDLITVGKELILPGAAPLTPPPPPAPAPAAAPAARTAPPAQSVTRSAAAAQPVTRNLPVPAPARQAAPVAPSSASGSIVSIAMQYNGSRYVWGGTTPAGFDCSGYIYYVLNQAGKGISRGLWGQYNAGPHPGRGELQPGDLVFFQNTYMPGLSHNGIYIGNGQFIHASDERSGVRVSSLSEPYWASRWFGAARV